MCLIGEPHRTTQNNCILQTSLELQNLDCWLWRQQKQHRWPIRLDGNSLFAAASMGLFKTTEYHREIREKVVKFMRQHWDKFCNFTKTKDRDIYLGHLADEGAPGSDAEIHAICLLYNINIEVIQGGTSSPIQETKVSPQGLDFYFTPTLSTLKLCKSCNMTGLTWMPDEHYDLILYEPAPLEVTDSDFAWRLHVTEMLEVAGVLSEINPGMPYNYIVQHVCGDACFSHQ